MTRSTEKFRELLAAPGILVQPAVPDPLSAAIAAEVGFATVGLGGYAMGAHRAISEPLLSLEDVAQMTRNITLGSRVPLMVDAGAGWGEPVHVMHTVRTLEQAGAASIHLEDQAFPKRVHYHQGVEEVISAAEMVHKLRAAVSARHDPAFTICARTDAMRTHGYDEGIKRARSYVEAGADMVMLFPNNEDESKAAPRDLPGVPLVYVNSTGNRFGRGVYSAEALHEWGWKMVYDAISVVNVMADSVRELLTTLRSTGEPGLAPDHVRAVRLALEHTIGLEDLYRIEAETVDVGNVPPRDAHVASPG